MTCIFLNFHFLWTFINSKGSSVKCVLFLNLYSGQKGRGGSSRNANFRKIWFLEKVWLWTSRPAENSWEKFSERHFCTQINWSSEFESRDCHVWLAFVASIVVAGACDASLCSIVYAAPHARLGYKARSNVFNFCCQDFSDKVLTCTTELSWGIAICERCIYVNNRRHTEHI